MKQTSFPGEELRERREGMGLSVYEVFRNTRIPAQYIEALERGDISALPGECFTIGFLRSYCAYLGADPAPYIDLFRECSRPPAGRFLRRASTAPSSPPPAWVGDLATWAVILGIVALGWLTYTVVFHPQPNGAETRVEAGTVEIEAPPTRGFTEP